ncbi:hypothetical protein [Microvirga antarctica]|uniref:hypothetical protein n=1 Tax=Microvirga antarctica TaxID=2819233 RepID=UPI001FE5144A|nr:hypothetical protein [Microvirga antarctica]
MHVNDAENWNYFQRVVQPALDLAPPTFLADIASSLEREGIQDAVAHHDSGPIFDWLVGLFALQGVSDAVAFGYSAKHGTAKWVEIEAALADKPDCHRLTSYWNFSDCKYQKAAGCCAEQHLLPECPLPRHSLRNGRLNQAAYSLFLFIRDVCEGDVVRWLDRRLDEADPGAGRPDRLAVMRYSLLMPLTNIYGVGSKLWSMVLADLLLCGDRNRERWVLTGSAQVAVDSLVHGFLHRTGILHRFNAVHAIGPSCYSPQGCARLIEGLAQRIDARDYHPEYPPIFARWVQHSIWAFCAIDGFDICNGNRINDSVSCRSRYCPAFDNCDRIPIRNVAR